MRREERRRITGCDIPLVQALTFADGKFVSDPLFGCLVLVEIREAAASSKQR